METSSSVPSNGKPPPNAPNVSGAGLTDAPIAAMSSGATIRFAVQIERERLGLAVIDGGRVAPLAIGGVGGPHRFDELAAVLHDPRGEFSGFHAQRIGAGPRRDDLVFLRSRLEPRLDREALVGLEHERLPVVHGDVSAALKASGGGVSRYGLAIAASHCR